MTKILVEGYERPFDVLDWSPFKGYALVSNEDIGRYVVVSAYTGRVLSEHMYIRGVERTWRAIRKAETPFKGKYRLIYETDVRACYQRYLDKHMESDAKIVFEALPWLIS